jgi:hypothetical protein
MQFTEETKKVEEKNYSCEQRFQETRSSLEIKISKFHVFCRVSIKPNRIIFAAGSVNE